MMVPSPDYDDVAWLRCNKCGMAMKVASRAGTLKPRAIPCAFCGKRRLRMATPPEADAFQACADSGHAAACTCGRNALRKAKN